MAFVTIMATQTYLDDTFRSVAEDDAQSRAVVQSEIVASELTTASKFAETLQSNRSLTSALQNGDFFEASNMLNEIAANSPAKAIFVLSQDGTTIGASNLDPKITETLNTAFGELQDGAVVAFGRGNNTDASVRNSTTRLAAKSKQPAGPTGPLSVTSAEKLTGNENNFLLVQPDLSDFVETWQRQGEIVILSDASGKILLSSARESTEEFTRLEEFEERLAEPLSIRENLSSFFNLQERPLNGLAGADVVRSDATLPDHDLKISFFQSDRTFRNRVNTMLAIEAFVFASLIGISLLWFSKAWYKRTVTLDEYSTKLRTLNEDLSAEIIERQRVEENLRSAQKTIAQKSKMEALGQVSASVGHELNQPLAALRNYVAGAKLLLNSARVQEARDNFENVENLVDRMAKISRQLGQFSRKSNTEPEIIDLRHPLKAAIALMQPQLASSETVLTSDLPDDPVIVLGDATRLEQILVNLLRNAFDAVKDKEAPTIAVKLATTEQDASISVSDNGGGIAEPEKLFEPFYTTKKSGEGVGLGLAISASIAAELNGHLSAANASDGAIFELQLPRHRSDQSETTAA